MKAQHKFKRVIEEMKEPKYAVLTVRNCECENLDLWLWKLTREFNRFRELPLLAGCVGCDRNARSHEAEEIPRVS